MVCSKWIAVCGLIFSLGWDVRPAWAVPFEGQKMIWAGPSHYAAETAKKIHQRGGNLVDAAVASALTLSVTSPYYASLGGGGFALIHLDGKTHALDFRERAPAATHPEFFVKNTEASSTKGGAAVAVPGVPAGLYALHKKFGRMKWKDLFVDALHLADKGLQVSGEWARSSQRADFSSGGLRHFRKPEGFYKPGDQLKQKALRLALQRLRDLGEGGFYTGPVAKDMVRSVEATGGVISLEDLKSYSVRWLEPLKAKFQGFEIHLMPPPSSGGVVLKTAFALAEKLNLQKQTPFSADEFHLLAEILSRSFRGRSLLGDPDFIKNPVEQLTSPKYVDELFKSIDLHRSKELKPLARAPGEESSETTHFSMMDAQGNAVAMTITLNGNFGSGVVSEKFGIALNNQMDDFTTRPGEPNMFGLIQGQGNLVQAGKRPLSSMSPSIVLQKGKPVLSLGGVGGPKIISHVFQAIYRTLITGLNMDEAIQSPRLHHQFLPNKIFVFKHSLQPATAQELTRRGHQVEALQDGGTRVFGVHRREDDLLEGAYDSQGEGAADGY